MNKESSHQLHAFISGRVQGVGFRYFVIRNAEELNLTGWVRNLGDGRVEVLAEGQMEKLNFLLIALRKGPFGADVSQVDYKFKPPSGKFSRFNFRSTA